MKRLRAARRRDGERTNRWINWSAATRLGMGLLTWASLCFMLLGYDLFPGRLSLQPGEPSPELVRAPRMARYEDQGETERLRAEAAARVLPVYTEMRFARPDAEGRVGQDFAQLEKARATADSPAELHQQLRWLPERSASWALTAGRSRLSGLEGKALGIVRELMSKQIRDETPDLRVAREEAEAMGLRSDREGAAAALVAAIAKRAVGPTYRLDEEATEGARNAARRRVQPVVRTIEADQPIIFADEPVTRQHMEILRALGLTSPKLDARRLAATALLVGLIVVLLGSQTRHWARAVYERPRSLLLLCLLAVVSMLVISLLTPALPNVWMLIVPAASLMAAGLLADTVAIALALALSLLVGLMADAGLPATLLALGSSAAAIALAPYLWPMSRLRVAVGAMAAANLLLVVSVGLLQGQPPAGLAKELALAGAFYGPGAALLALGGVYMLQRPFGITTQLALLELGNPQLPLLKQLQTEAPGTYHHSLMVASLAEAAAEAVGADALLTRVGALYHDIGKLSRPGFFVENQAVLGVDNAHDRLSSSLSGLIIISHVKDGVELARKHRLPPDVISIIAEHHGETTMTYFYHQALAGSRPEEVSEEQFRYPGPLPSTKEAAIVMLADGVHAATKSIAEPTPQRIQQMVREIFRERVVGRQLERCDLTFRQIASAETVMGRVLTLALCRDRIAYPEPLEDRVGL
ncbi:MAG: HD family phosphohydrolase [Armatimonadota bacterium]